MRQHKLMSALLPTGIVHNYFIFDEYQSYAGHENIYDNDIQLISDQQYVIMLTNKY